MSSPANNCSHEYYGGECFERLSNKDWPAEEFITNTSGKDLGNGKIFRKWF
jgi:hypothetical protein